MSNYTFPRNFTWGVATSSQQIEGAIHEGGRGPSIWDRFESEPGRISDGTNSAVACDHYHRWREDVDLLKDLGVGAYRFSIAWPRIQPSGRGLINAPGLDFYDKLVDALLEVGIRPFATLYHWDLPLALQEEGGWVSRNTMDAFVEYVDVVTSALGDRVKHWITHNEPWCIAALGHEHGEHAPGEQNPANSLRVAHHIMVSHGLAVPVIRSNVPSAKVGIALNLTPAFPASDSDADRAAAQQFDGTFNRWYLDPLIRGTYPEDVIDLRVRMGHLDSRDLPFVEAGDMKAIMAPTDFLGVNYYSRAVMKMGAEGFAEGVDVAAEEDRTQMGWEVYPDGLEVLLRRLHQEYDVPRIYITENGAAYPDPPPQDGRFSDPKRVRYLRDHLLAAHRAIEAGVPLAGYFAWSFMDNFEWAFGYTKHFGLYRVEFDSQRRIPRESARWYKRVMAENGLCMKAPTTSTAD